MAAYKARRACRVCRQSLSADSYHEHERALRKPRTPAPPSVSYTWAERRRRAQVVAAWRAQHGDWCPGWQRAPHPATNLSADHPVPRSLGGSEDQLLAVLCSGCNASKGGRRGRRGQ